LIKELRYVFENGREKGYPFENGADFQGNNVFRSILA
jgi:hypothetical protein